MTRKVRRVRYQLDSKDVKSISRNDLIAILRAADSLIMSGGRQMLSKILKGSKDKKLLELELDDCPFYGYFNKLTLPNILARIDWTIKNGYLEIEYNFRLPFLVYTEAGWQIEKDTYSSELLDTLSKMADNPVTGMDLSFLKDRNRKMILMLLDKVNDTNDPKFIPVLECWKQVDYKKIQQRIDEVIEHLIEFSH
jgi:superfamily II DNA helicase RecQ